MIKINQLKKSHPDFDLNVSMNIKKGLVTGLIGKNGSGKSTIYKSILDLIQIDDGSITILNKLLKSVACIALEGFPSFLTNALQI